MLGQVPALFCRFQYRTRQVTQRSVPRNSSTLATRVGSEPRCILIAIAGVNEYLKRALAGDAFFWG